ncbi:MAG: Ppx/GppA family phosphatase [Solirubrobacteraceae bacterium]|nr:Ppx/GppA family phosphatase [Solirubrobacteraceae bacterium]
MRRLAVVDLGSNSFRLVVFRHEPGGAWAVWDEIRDPVRLSAGMGADNMLQPDPVSRALDTVGTFAAFCRETQVDDVLAVGTSALRRATNGPEVVAEMEARGLEVRILDEREEAYYGALAILNSTRVSDGFGLDMGGGSVQLMQLAGRELGESVSFPLGAVRATEDFLAGEQRSGLKALRKEVRRLVADVPWFSAGDGPLAGIGGSVRNLAAAAQRLHELPNGGVQGFVLTAEMLSAVVEELAGRDVEERRQLPGINPDRGDVILAAAVVLESILAEGGFDRIEITEAGLREGLFFERYLADHEPPVHADVGRASVANLVARHEVDPDHAARVRDHALALYDGLADQEAIEASAADRRLLESAALLHDIGRSVGFDNRHKHARYLVMDEGLPGFDREATATIAQIVRYMPKGAPEPDTRVELLAGVLRVAEQLERTRSCDVDGVEVRVEKKRITVIADTRADASVSVWAAAHSTDLLADALGRDVEVVSRSSS